MIDVEKLTKYYGQRAAVRDVSFHVAKGEILGLLGPNGAGKTTTMRMLTGYLPATSGDAVVAGYNVADNPMEVRRRLGYLPETVPLYTDMTVRAYLDFTAKLRGVPGKGRKSRVEEVMELCRISEVKNKVIAKISRGYRQRVGLAQAIVHNPQVIILDEPTVGLDPRQIIEIRQVIRDLAGGHSLILSTHILPEVSTLCDRVVIINRGRVLVDKTLAELEQQGAGNERLRLEIRGPAQQVQIFLASQPGILQIEQASADNAESDVDMLAREPRELNRFMVEAAPGIDLREQLAKAIIGQGWGLLEMRTAAPSLEEIFVRLINTDEAAELEDEEADELTDEDEELDEPEEEDTLNFAKPAPSFLQKAAGEELDEPAPTKKLEKKDNKK
ncbi:MAG: ATP-binding cassette domain-containing protein [Chloroflexota bacterium]|nr:ATP-binding cassette domain-containing protein [Chloroflexota bacterium]